MFKAIKIIKENSGAGESPRATIFTQVLFSGKVYYHFRG
jgi:hypothetical protein